MKNEWQIKENEIKNDLLGYPGLSIIQRPDCFNFSLDSTLLADFVTINKRDKEILDMGCGNGYIPIFLTLRTKSHITGVEIQSDIYDMAVRSVKYNGLDNQITLLNNDIKDLDKLIGKDKIDCITCNPPYFKYQESSNINKNDYLTIARHEVLIDIEEICKKASLLLRDGGRFALVHRTDRMLDVLDAYRNNGIEPKRLRFVYPKKDSKDSLIFLIEGIKSKNKGGLKILKPMYIYNKNGKYTKEVLKIFNYKEEQ